MKSIQTTFNARLPRSLDDMEVFMRVEVNPNLPTNLPTLAQLAQAMQAAVDAFQKTMRTGKA